MNILIKQQTKGGQIKKFALEKHNRIIIAQPGERIELIDSETGKLPEKTQVRRAKEKLVFDIDGEENAFEVHDFFKDCSPANSCLVALNEAGTDRTILIVQSEEAAEAMGTVEELRGSDLFLTELPSTTTAAVTSSILWPYVIGGAGIFFGMAGSGGGGGGSATIANHAPAAVADTGVATASGTKEGMAARGNVLKNDGDADAGDTISVVEVGGQKVGVALQGKHGVLTLNADGSYVYEVDNADPEVRALGSAEESLLESFTYVIQDRTGATASASLDIVIEGANDAPLAANDIATAGAAGILPGFSAIGNVLANDRDVDLADSIGVTGLIGGILGTSLTGKYGTLVLNADGTYRYDVQAGNPAVDALGHAGHSLSESFTYTLRDRAGAISSAILTIQITGAENAPFLLSALPGQEGTIGGEIAPLDTSMYFIDPDMGDALSYRLNEDAPAWLSIDMKSGVLRGVPTGPGIFNISVIASDLHGASVTTSFTFHISEENHAPVATADSASAVEKGAVINGTAATGNVLANDIDADKDLLAVAGIKGGQIGIANSGKYGSLLLSKDGGYIYEINNADPAVNALRSAVDTLVDTFTYSIVDDSGATASATLSVTIHGTNDAPVSGAVIKDQAGQVGQAIPPLAIKKNFSDPDLGDTLSYSLAAGAPSWLTIDSTTGNISGTPTAAGNYHVTVTVTDTAKGQVQSSFLLVVAPADIGGDDIPPAPPVPAPLAANPDTAVATEAGATVAGINSAGNVLSNDTGGTGLKSVSAITGGSVGASVAGAYGALMMDGAGGYSYTLDNADATVMALRTTGDTLIETFTYTVIDSIGSNAVSTLQITIQGANDAPLAAPDAIAVNRSATVSATAGTGLLSNDVDNEIGESLSVSGIAQDTVTKSVTNAAPGMFTTDYGTFTVKADGSYTYIADGATSLGLKTGESVSETFTYTLADASGATASASVTITIQGNDNIVPVALPDSDTATETGTAAGIDASGTVLGNDSDPGDTIIVSDITGGSVQASTAGAYGTLTLNADGSYVYKIDDANASVNALRTASDTLVDTFTYTIKDSVDTLATSTLTVTIEGANDAPIAVADTATATEQGAAAGSGANGNVLNNDTDVDAGDGKTVSAISGGVLQAATKGLHGSITLDDKGGYSYVVDESDVAVNALWRASDTLTEQFTYTVSDTAGASSSSVLTITIQGSNDAPLPTDDSISVSRTQTLAASTKSGLLANDFDPDTGDAVSIVRLSQLASDSTVSAASAGVIASTYGTLTVNQNGSFSYDANGASSMTLTSGESAIDTFTYTVSDMDGATSTASIQFTIQGNANVAPTAIADFATATEQGVSAGSDANGNVLQNDTDPDSTDSHTVEAIAGGVLQSQVTGKYGNLTLNFDGKYDYVVDDSNASINALRLPGDTLTDVFTYTMSDNFGATSSTTLTITITGANDAPQAAGNTGSISKLSTLTVDAANGLVKNAIDVDLGDTLTISEFVQGASSQSVSKGTPGTLATSLGTLTINDDGSYDYLADGAASVNLTAGMTAIDTFTYTVMDLAGATVTAVLAITVAGSVNHDPVSVPDVGSATEDGTVNPTGDVLQNDSDADANDKLTVTSIAGSAAGMIGGSTAGMYGTLTLNCWPQVQMSECQPNRNVAVLTCFR